MANICLKTYQGVPCTLILSSTVGYLLEQVSFIMTSVEGVERNSAKVNKIGNYTDQKYLITRFICGSYSEGAYFSFIVVLPLNE